MGLPIPPEFIVLRANRFHDHHLEAEDDDHDDTRQPSTKDGVNYPLTADHEPENFGGTPFCKQT